MVILTLLATLVAFALGAFVSAKCIQLGLKYQVQISKGTEPKLEPMRPIVDAVNNHKEEVSIRRENEVIKSVYDELMNGGGDPV